MSNLHHLTAEQVLQDIAAELQRPPAAEPPAARAIAALRRRQQDFRASPVLGGLLWLKQIIFSLNWSTFAQQFEVNDQIIEALAELHYELSRQQVTLTRRLAQLEQTIAASAPANPSGEPSTYRANPQIPLPGLSHLFSVPAEMLLPERLLLYSLVYSLQPRTCLEIGTFRGGSARLIIAALDDLDAGRLIAVDPNPKIAAADLEQMTHRLTLVAAATPGAVAQAAQLAGQPFDFVLIDGDHSYQGVLQDIEAVLPYLDSTAYLLLHDCHYPEIARAITQALRQHPGSLSDGGVLSTAMTRQQVEGQAEPVNWGGLRLLRYQRS